MSDDLMPKPYNYRWGEWGLNIPPQSPNSMSEDGFGLEKCENGVGLKISQKCEIIIGHSLT